MRPGAGALARRLAVAPESRQVRGLAAVVGLAASLLCAAPAAAQHVPHLTELRGLEAAADAVRPMVVDGLVLPPPERARAYASGWTARAADASRPPTQGALRILVILAGFADSNDPPRFSQEDLQVALFDGPTERGTVSELYDEASLGALAVSGTVTRWHRSSLTLPQVRGGDLNGGAPARTGEYLLEALAAVDAELDLGQFDNDGPDGIPNSGDDNGLVDSVFFLYGEVGAHCGGNGPWPHFFGVSVYNDQKPWPSADDRRPDGTPIQVDPYVLSTVVDCTGNEVGAVGVAAHELGHVVGLPDIYHPGPPPDGHLAVNRRWVLGCWDLMAAGAWGCGPADQTTGRFGPTSFSAWSRDRLGWLTLDVADGVSGQEYVLEPVQTSGRALLVPMGGPEPESFLVEYRPQLGFDRLLPAGGVLIYRWHEDGAMRPDSTQRYQVSMVEADDNASLQRNHGQGGNRGEAGDAWAADGSEASFSARTRPATLLSSGDPSRVTFHSIRVGGGVARVRLTNTDQPLALGQDRLLAPFLLDGAAPPTDDEADLLDIAGNQNGVYDVGDLRARLIRP